VHTILEYVGITLIFIFVLLIMGYYISIPLTSLSAIKSEQLTSISQRMLNTIVLTTGDPEDWGRRTNNPTSFGLKLENTSATLYVLNPDKITRLANGSMYSREFFNPLYIDKETVSQILGAYRSYGFRIELQPVPNITIVKQDSYKFDVYVNDKRNMSLPGVSVTLYYIIVKEDGGKFNMIVIVNTSVSDINGKCSFNLQPYLSTINWNDVIGYLIVAKAAHQGSISVAVSDVGDYNITTLVGKCLFVDQTLTPNGVNDVRYIDSIKTVFSDGKSQISYRKGQCIEFIPLVNSSITPVFPINVSAVDTYTVNGKTFFNYTLDFVDYYAYIVIMVGYDGSKYRLIIALRPPLIKYGYNVPKGNVETLERFVNIAGYSYILRLYIWRTEI